MVGRIPAGGCIKVAVNEAAGTVFASADRKAIKPMKPHLIPMLVTAVLLLVPAQSGWALPPRQHSVNGTIESVDWTSRQITLKSTDGTSALVLAWNDRTRFTKSADCAKCSLAVGRAVSTYYRREAGQNVLREVSSKDATCQQGQP